VKWKKERGIENDESLFSGEWCLLCRYIVWEDESAFCPSRFTYFGKSGKK
jgi:hypothetical protein